MNDIVLLLYSPYKVGSFKIGRVVQTYPCLINVDDDDDDVDDDVVDDCVDHVNDDGNSAGIVNDASVISDRNTLAASSNPLSDICPRWGSNNCRSSSEKKEKSKPLKDPSPSLFFIMLYIAKII